MPKNHNKQRLSTLLPNTHIFPCDKNGQASLDFLLKGNKIFGDLWLETFICGSQSLVLLNFVPPCMSIEQHQGRLSGLLYVDSTSSIPHNVIYSKNHYFNISTSMVGDINTRNYYIFELLWSPSTNCVTPQCTKTQT